MLNLTVNGKNRELEQSQDLVSFLQSYGVNLNFIAVAYNGDVLDKEDFPSIVLKAGDVLEIVRPVGGGGRNQYLP